MKTILSRMKTVVESNKNPGQTLFYVQHVEVVHPDVAKTFFSKPNLPGIFLVPVTSSEVWDKSQLKRSDNTVRAYLIMHYQTRELSILGDAARANDQNANGKGILDFVSDFAEVFRGHRLAVDGQNYLDKPLDIVDIEYGPAELSEDVYAIVATITMQCSYLFLQTTLPGNIQ